MIDSAQAYEEEQVGAAVQESGILREDIFIVSKVHPRFLGHDETLKSVEETLTKLKVLIYYLTVDFWFHLGTAKHVRDSCFPCLVQDLQQCIMVIFCKYKCPSKCIESIG